MYNQEPRDGATLLRLRCSHFYPRDMASFCHWGMASFYSWGMAYPLDDDFDSVGGTRDQGSLILYVNSSMNRSKGKIVPSTRW